MFGVVMPSNKTRQFTSQTHYMGDMFRLEQLAIIRPQTEKRTSNTFGTLCPHYMFSMSIPLVSQRQKTPKAVF
jgi:hypothetical protein